MNEQNNYMDIPLYTKVDLSTRSWKRKILREIRLIFNDEQDKKCSELFLNKLVKVGIIQDDLDTENYEYIMFIKKVGYKSFLMLREIRKEEQNETI